MLSNQEIKTPVLIEDFGMEYPTVNSKEKRRYGLFKCSCGNEFKAITSYITSGHTNSCGCYQKQRVSESNTTHGMIKHPLYSVWRDMVQRCTNSKNKSFKDYGGRGISVCDRWLKFENFRDDMYPTYEDGLSIDRIDVNGNYELLNCRWTTKTVQHRNTRLLRSDNASGYRGVSFYKPSKKWFAQIGINGKRKHLGYFITALEAATAYDKYVIENNLEHTINGVSTN